MYGLVMQKQIYNCHIPVHFPFKLLTWSTLNLFLSKFHCPETDVMIDA